jgi:hypothetical protein
LIQQPLEARIAKEQLLHHLVRVVVVVLRQADAKTLHAGSQHGVVHIDDRVRPRQRREHEEGGEGECFHGAVSGVLKPRSFLRVRIMRRGPEERVLRGLGLALHRPSPSVALILSNRQLVVARRAPVSSSLTTTFPGAEQLLPP